MRTRAQCSEVWQGQEGELRPKSQAARPSARATIKTLDSPSPTTPEEPPDDPSHPVAAITELKRNPMATVSAGDGGWLFSTCNQPAFYCVPCQDSADGPGRPGAQHLAGCSRATGRNEVTLDGFELKFKEEALAEWRRLTARCARSSKKQLNPRARRQAIWPSTSLQDQIEASWLSAGMRSARRRDSGRSSQ